MPNESARHKYEYDCPTKEKRQQQNLTQRKQSTYAEHCFYICVLAVVVCASNAEYVCVHKHINIAHTIEEVYAMGEQKAERERLKSHKEQRLRDCVSKGDERKENENERARKWLNSNSNDDDDDGDDE